MKRILITGGLGFIGSHLVDVFQKEGNLVRILDIPSRPEDLSSETEYIQGSVNDPEAWKKALAKIEYVIHLAAYQGYENDFSTYMHVNAVSTALLYEAVVKNSIPLKQVILASSQSVYGEGKYRCDKHGIFFPQLRLPSQLEKREWDIVCVHDKKPAQILSSEENDVLMPVSPYGVSKLAADHAARLLGRAHGIPTTILRFSMVYGAHGAMRGLYAKSLNFFTEKALKNEEIPIHEDGNQLRDLIDVKDIGSAVAFSVGNTAMFLQIFNVGSGTSISMRDLASEVCNVLGVSFQPVFKGEFRPFTPRHWMMSIEKIRAIGWAPRYTMDQSVKEYIEAAKKFVSQ